MNTKSGIVQQLQKEVISMQGGYARSISQQVNTGLGPIEKSFPNGMFPIGAVHEFISSAAESATATNGFICSLLKQLARNSTCLWVSMNRTIFPPALELFGVAPENVIFIDVSSPREALWVIEEGLKCKGLGAVVGEFRELGFTESRRLQLAVEQSHVTGLIHRHCPRNKNTIACITRWTITPLASKTDAGLPGIGNPRWNVKLEKVRNGRPGTWQLEWSDNSFRFLLPDTVAPGIHTLKTA